MVQTALPVVQVQINTWMVQHVNPAVQEQTNTTTVQHVAHLVRSITVEQLVLQAVRQIDRIWMVHNVRQLPKWQLFVQML